MPHHCVDRPAHQTTDPPATAAGLPVRVPGATRPPPRPAIGEEMVARIRQARPETAQRALLGVVVMHEPDRRGRCRHCRAHGRLWWRRSVSPCSTVRALAAEMAADTEPVSA